MQEVNSPFKFLDPYTLEDRELFFGRDNEVDTLYDLVFETNLILVYGPSGTGKSSLIQCGLASRFQSTDWHDLYIRRRDNINQSLRDEIKKNALTEIPEDAEITKAIESLFLDYFKPIYLIFDQFEELYLLGGQEEREEFIRTMSALLQAELSCKVIIVMREE
ncbi:MAG: ATP-binding protein, partial [Saprospiraceae bacterium]|nr:ATP-binding protein [Saprospiraceae bacterium]